MYICVMVLEKPIRRFYWNRLSVQYFDDVVKAAKLVTKIDGKERVDEPPKLKVRLSDVFDNLDTMFDEKIVINDNIDRLDIIDYDLLETEKDFYPKKCLT